MIIKTTLGYIFGGFISIAWCSTGGVKTDNNAFLFSFVNALNISFKTMISLNKNAINCDAITGPNFIELVVYNNSNTNTNSFHCSGGSYITSLGHMNNDHYFKSVEIEVFQI